MRVQNIISYGKLLLKGILFKAKSVVCFLIDAPMGLHHDTPWSLEQLCNLINEIESNFNPPYTIVIYSQYSQGEVQRALAALKSPQRGAQTAKLQLTKFVMVKVQHRPFCRNTILTSILYIITVIMLHVSCRTLCRREGRGPAPTCLHTWYRRYW